MALPQIVTKTYSRRRLRQSDVSRAERTFDEVFREESRPPSRTSATAEKWGTATFKRICNATRMSPKRRLSPTHNSDDPFSFDSDDDNSAKKLKKENIRQKTAVSTTTKLSAGSMDGRCSVDTERHVAGEKSRSQLTSCKEKSCADEQHGIKQCAEKVTRCRTAVKAKLRSVDCADGEQNGLSSYCLATANMSDRGDSLELNERNCRSNGVDSVADGHEKKPCGRAAGRNTRSSGSPCKTTQQLKVFVDNFQLLFSSQRSPAADRHSQPDISVSSSKLSSAGQLTSPATKSKRSQNCYSDLSHLPSSASRRQRGSTVKTASNVSSSLHHRKQLHQNSTDDNDNDDDDDDVILLSPLPRKPAAVHSVGSVHRASDTGKTISGNCSVQSSSSKSSSTANTRSGRSTNSLSLKSVSCSGSNKNEVVCDKSVQLRLHRMRTSDEHAASHTTATTAAAAAVTTATSTRRLLTGSRRNAVRTKAVYNPRQWNDSDDLGSLSSSQSSSANTSLSSSSSSAAAAAAAAVSRDDAVCDMQTPPISSSSSCLNTASLLSASSPSSAGSAKVTVSRDQKLLYTVVRNVKQAHECQEYGETQEFCDDIEYILDGLSDTQPVPTRCLSAMSLASKCSTSAFRMHIRADDTFMKMLSALHNAPHNPRLALCTSAVMYLMSCDHLAMHIDAASLQLMLRLLSLDSASDDDDFCRTRLRLHNIVQQTRQQATLTLDNMTPGQLVLETLLSLTSKQAGDWFKDSLRTLGGLDQLVNTVTRCVETLDSRRLSSVQMTEQLHRVERCIRVLERVTYLNTDNQNYLLSCDRASLIHSVHRLVQLCVRRLPSCVSEDAHHSDTDRDGDTVRVGGSDCVSVSVVSTCLLTSLRLLLNMTHDNNAACSEVGAHEGLLNTVLTSTLQSPQYVSAVSRFDLVILGVGLLTNLVESCEVNRERLIQVKCPAPYDCHYSPTADVIECLEALGMLFSVRYEAAKLIEEEQEAEIEEAERRKALLPDSSQSTDHAGHSGDDGGPSGGGWYESESGLFWEPCDSSVLDSSSDGLAAMHAARQQAAALAANGGGGGAASQLDDEESYTRVLHTAGRHMEDSIMAAYIALLIGTLIQHKQDLAEHVRETLPSFSFSPMVQMLSKFLGFMNLTSASATNASKSIQRAIETLDAC